MNMRPCSAACVVVVVLLEGCGNGDTSKQTTSGATGGGAPPSVTSVPAEGKSPDRVPPKSRRSGPYRFVRAPLVIVDQEDGFPGAPHAYVRLNRSLPGSGINRVKAVITVNGYAGGGRTTAFSGVARCYEQIADALPLPETLRVGDRARVALRVTGRPRGTASVTVTIKGAVSSTATDDGYQDPYLRALGCRLPEPDA